MPPSSRPKARWSRSPPRKLPVACASACTTRARAFRRHSARMTHERCGKMRVDMVSDSMTAIGRIAPFKPDLVMLDWRMPGMDGPTLFRKMKEDPEAAKLPVVFITARAAQRDMDELIAL